MDKLIYYLLGSTMYILGIKYYIMASKHVK